MVKGIHKNCLSYCKYETHRFHGKNTSTCSAGRSGILPSHTEAYLGTRSRVPQPLTEQPKPMIPSSERWRQSQTLDSAQTKTSQSDTSTANSSKLSFRPLMMEQRTRTLFLEPGPGFHSISPQTIAPNRKDKKINTF